MFTQAEDNNLRREAFSLLFLPSFVTTERTFKED